MSHRIEVNYLGVVLELDVEYEPADGDGWNEPHTPAHFIINDVLHNDGSIAEMLSGEQWKHIESLVEEEYGVAA